MTVLMPDPDAFSSQTIDPETGAGYIGVYAKRAFKIPMCDLKLLE